MDNHVNLSFHQTSQPAPTYRGFIFHVSRFILSVCFLLITGRSVQAVVHGTDLFQELHPGLRIYRYDWPQQACILYVAEMDRSHPNLHFEAAIARDAILGKETVRSIAHRRSQRDDRQVLVAVNGGFGVLGDMKGYGGALENLHIQNGELMTQPTDKEACFGVTADGDFLIGPVQMKATVTIGTHAFPIECINQRFLDDCKSILYTPRMGFSTHTNRKRAYEIILTGLRLPITGKYKNAFVVDRFGKGGNNPIPEEGAAISFRSRIDKKLAAQLHEENRGKIEIALEPAIWNRVVHAIGGRLRLVKNGKVNELLEKKHRAEKEHTLGERKPDLVLSYEPRTALGFNDQKLILIVADGRQPGYSTGLSLYQLASLFIALGAMDAINLDGGSSSTFVVDGKVVNRPSGQSERDVLNAVFITVGKGR